MRRRGEWNLIGITSCRTTSDTCCRSAAALSGRVGGAWWCGLWVRSVGAVCGCGLWVGEVGVGGRGREGRWEGEGEGSDSRVRDAVGMMAIMM